MKKHPVVICSDKVNRYGFRMLASGISLAVYEKNPIVLYAHQRPSHQNPQITPVAKMHDVALDATGQLIGNIEFDQDDEFAVKLEKKWEKGMLNTVSLRAQVLQVSEEPEFLLEGQTYPTVTQSLLEEISIEPIPGDSDAVAMRLHYHNEDEQVISLTSNETSIDFEKLFPTQKPKTNMKLIQLAFAGQNLVTVSKDADEEAVANAVVELVNKANESVSLSAKLTEKETEIVALKASLASVELAAKEDKANALIDGAIAAKKITPGEKPEYLELAKTNFDAVKTLLDKKKGFTSVTEMVAGGEGETKFAKLSYDEMDKKGLLAEFKATDPEGFKVKFKEKYGVEPRA